MVNNVTDGQARDRKTNHSPCVPHAAIRPLLIVFIVLTLLAPGLFASAESASSGPNQNRVIKVGFPIQNGLSFIDDEGNLSGYTYEYLMRLAQYADWKYEFVQLEGDDMNTVLSEMLDMLKRGEIDILGVMAYSDQLAQIYDFPGYSYGTSYTALYVLQDNTVLNETNYLTKENLRIATRQPTTRAYKNLVHFCETNKLSPEFIVCDDIVEQLDALKSGRADVMVNIDVNFIPGVRSIAKFSPRPYYLATTKGNTEIINTLNTAMLKLTKADPTCTANLYEKYFEEPNNSFYLLQEELDFIEGAGVIRVGMDSGKAPIQYRDPRTGEPRGISTDVLALISEKTGLRFETVMVDSQQELYDLYETGEIDAIAGIISMNYLANEYLDMALTDAYVTSQLDMIMSQDRRDEAGMSNLGALKYNYLKATQEQNVTATFRTVEEAIKAVAEGEVDHAYASSYMAQYYTDYLYLDKLVIVPQVNQHVSVLFALRKSTDQKLLGIFNKAIRSITPEQLQGIIYRNAAIPKNMTFSAFIKTHPVAIVSLIAGIAALIISGLLMMLRIRAKATQRMKIDNDLYQKLCRLSNEYIFEYDYLADHLFVIDDSLHFIENTMAYDVEEKERPLIEIIKQGDGDQNLELFCVLPDGTQRWLRLSTTTVASNIGVPLYKLGKITDIQQERLEKDKLRELSRRDSLTELFNVHSTRTQITGLLQQTAGTLFLIDVDHFKDINDRYGHYIGDQVLTTVAKCLREVFDGEDVIGRIGGDEFMAFHPSLLSERQVDDIFSALRDRLEAQRLEREDIGVTVSLGVILVKAGASFATSYQKVDEVMYQAKKAGRNNYRFSPEMD